MESKMVTTTLEAKYRNANTIPKEMMRRKVIIRAVSLWYSDRMVGPISTEHAGLARQTDDAGHGVT